MYNRFSSKKTWKKKTFKSKSPKIVKFTYSMMSSREIITFMGFYFVSKA